MCHSNPGGYLVRQTGVSGLLPQLAVGREIGSMKQRSASGPNVIKHIPCICLFSFHSMYLAMLLSMFDSDASFSNTPVIVNEL